MDNRTSVGLGVVALVGVLTGCASATWERPVKSDNTAPGAAVAKNALEAPDRVGYLKEQQAQLESRLEAAQAASAAGNLDDSERLLNEALAIDPQNRRAHAELDRVADLRRHPLMIEEARGLLEKGDEFGAEKRVRQVLMENPKNQEALDLYTGILKKREEKKALAPVLSVIKGKTISLDFREANLKMVFEALSRSTGIKFILDKVIRPDQKTTVFIKSAPLQDVLDSLLSANQLQKKIINENTVVVYPNTPIKAKEYQELVMRTFYLANADVKQTVGLLKGMLQIKDVFTDDKINLLVIRDTPDVIRLAEQLIQSQDVAEPEVMLEMEVLEVNRTKALELGVEFPSSLSVIGTQTLKTIKSLSSADWQLDGGPNLHFKKTDTLANVLANPRIRVKNREKAHVHVGSRKPIFTTNITPQGGQNQTVQYIDDGLKLEVEPVINVDDDVTIRVALDYSTSSPTGTAYTINTRNATTQLRLRDGETQVLAGLIKDSDTDTQAKVPGLGDIPGIGRLFSYNKPSRDKTDLILAITPHVIRNLPPQSAARAEVFIGTESSMGRVPTTIRDGMVLPPTLAPFMTMPAKKPADNPAPAAPAGGSNAPAGNNGQTQGSGNAGNGGTQGQDSNSGFGLGLPKSLTFPGGQPQ